MKNDKEVRKGVLLINLGTPDDPEPAAVGRYLLEFLMDKWVIDIWWPLRWILVHILIVPRRKFASSHAYKKIWTAQGSPLLVHTLALAKELQLKRQDWVVAAAMRYGKPSIRKGLEELNKRGVTDLVVLPLYPQYAESSTRTSIEKTLQEVKNINAHMKVRTIQFFYKDPGFIKAYADRIRATRTIEATDHLLMSFHGLPEHHLRKTDLSGKHCLASAECSLMENDANRFCYRAHCYATAQAIARELGLKEREYSVAFQSRLGKKPWIKPFTDEVLVALPGSGVRRLTVVCPSFTSDCLETLEEIAIRGANDFMAAGGQYFSAVPCLNSDPLLVTAVENLVEKEFLIK